VDHSVYLDKKENEKRSYEMLEVKIYPIGVLYFITSFENQYYQFMPVLHKRCYKDSTDWGVWRLIRDLQLSMNDVSGEPMVTTRWMPPPVSLSEWTQNDDGSSDSPGTSPPGYQPMEQDGGSHQTERDDPFCIHGQITSSAESDQCMGGDSAPHAIVSGQASDLVRVLDGHKKVEGPVPDEMVEMSRAEQTEGIPR
jgi:hypothetical protein